jgi:hypothetical protein
MSSVGCHTIEWRWPSIWHLFVDWRRRIYGGKSGDCGHKEKDSASLKPQAREQQTTKLALAK